MAIGSAGGGLGRAGGTGSWPVVRFEETGSTNDEALARARAGLAEPCWFVTDRQSAGRGRRGRVWASDKGNLYATALLVDPGPAERLPDLPFVVAVALQRAVARSAATAANRPMLKWPNDLMFAGRKAAGILLEATRLPDGRDAVAVGIGVNLAFAPTGTEMPATSLLAEGISLLPEILLADLDESLRDELAEWDRGLGFGRVRRRWLDVAVGLGEPIRVRLLDRELHGRFEAIDESGRLILAEAGGERRSISAGDVFFPPRGGDEVK